MKHKIISIIAAAAAVLVGTAACNLIEENDNEPVVITMSITAQPDSVVVIAEGGEAVFNFNAPDYWFVSSPVNWLQFDTTAGKPGEATLKVTAAQNTSARRKAEITVTAKSQRGKFWVVQEAWPYNDGWTVAGALAGGSRAMEDKAEGLVWEATKVHYYAGETFKLSMGTTNAVILGLDGELSPVKDTKNTFTGKLKKGGDNISLPEDGFWDITLDLNTWTVTAALAERYPWTIIGTIDGDEWTKDIAMDDKGEQLVWEVAQLPFRTGNEFKFRREANNTVNLGLDGAFTAVEGEENTYKASLKQDGANISLPGYCLWKVTLDLNDNTVTIVRSGGFPWTIVGNINKANWDQDFAMSDKGGQMVWAAERIPFYEGEAFKFRMDSNDVENLGIDGEFEETGEENTYKVSVKRDGEAIALPAEGWWNLTLDLNDNSLTAFLAEEFPRVHEGVFWENEDPDGLGGVSWNGTYRFALDGHDGNKEALTTLPEEVWNRIKTETFYMPFKQNADWYQIRVTDGWWQNTWTGNDITPGSEKLTDNGDGTLTLEVNLDGDPLVDVIDVQHLLFTGDGYTPLGLYPKATWKNNDPAGNGSVSWNGKYRFGLEEHDGGNECITVFPETVWNKIKTETFHVIFTQDADWFQIRVTDGWWSTTWSGDDVYPGSELITDNGDGTFTLELTLGADPLVGVIDVQHLLLTGSGYTPLEIRVKW